MTGLYFPNAVTEERDLFGRKGDLRLIESTFSENQHVPVLVIGERRTGKTSLMNVVIRRLKDPAIDLQGARYAVLSLEPRGITTFSAFARAILLRMSTLLWSAGSSASLRPDRSIPEIDSNEHFEVEFGELLRYSGQETFLVCIDEFDEIVRQTRGPELARIRGLINYLVERANLPISFFFTMTSIPDALKDEAPSTLVSMAQVLELHPFDPDDVCSLALEVSGTRLAWEKAWLDQLYRVCGGHPYFTKLVLNHLFYLCPDCGSAVALTQVLFDEAIRRALRDPRTENVFENLYHIHFSPAEREVILLLARRQVPLQEKELKQVGATWVTAARRLVKRNYLVDRGSGYEFRATFMGEWMRDWAAFEEECAQYSTLQKKLAIPKEIEVNVGAGQVIVLGVPVRLSAQEFSIMDFLSERAGQLVRREELVDRVWETDQGVSDQVIDTAFYRLRKKIGDQGQYIETIPGQGFVLHRAVRTTGQERSRSSTNEGGAE